MDEVLRKALPKEAVRPAPSLSNEEMEEALRSGGGGGSAGRGKLDELRRAAPSVGEDEDMPRPKRMPSPEAMRLIREEEKRALAEAAEQKATAGAVKDYDKDPYTFVVEFEDDFGRVERGEFTCHILTLAERSEVGLLRAQMAGGLPYESLDPETRDINRMIAHMTHCFDSAPTWFKQGVLKNATEKNGFLLSKVWAEVEAHQIHYFRKSKDKSQA